jgi:hypothetical protein
VRPRRRLRTRQAARRLALAGGGAWRGGGGHPAAAGGGAGARHGGGRGGVRAGGAGAAAAPRGLVVEGFAGWPGVARDAACDAARLGESVRSRRWCSGLVRPFDLPVAAKTGSPARSVADSAWRLNTRRRPRPQAGHAATGGVFCGRSFAASPATQRRPRRGRRRRRRRRVAGDRGCGGGGGGSGGGERLRLQRRSMAAAAAAAVAALEAACAG